MSEEQAEYMGEAPDHTEYQIREESPHDYYCQIPNLVDELDLTPQAYRLYGHLKRVAGESGKCWQSTKTLSEKCRMSAGAISEAKRELENTYPPLIRITSKTKENGIYHEIVVTDIWQINHDFWTGGAVHIVKTPRKRSQCENPRSQCETKNNPLIQEEPKNGGKPPIDPSTLPIDWQMLGDGPVVLPDERLAKQKDAAALVGMGMGVLAEPAAALALAFQVARGVVFTESQIKGQRKAAKSLIEQKITPALVAAAVKKLQAAGMTVTDLYSITKTAIDLANKNDAPKIGRALPEIG